jgi:hypothetical protein
MLQKTNRLLSNTLIHLYISSKSHREEISKINLRSIGRKGKNNEWRNIKMLGRQERKSATVSIQLRNQGYVGLLEDQENNFNRPSRTSNGPFQSL